jgi:hypothetical protein
VNHTIRFVLEQLRIALHFGHVCTHQIGDSTQDQHRGRFFCVRNGVLLPVSYEQLVLDV